MAKRAEKPKKKIKNHLQSQVYTLARVVRRDARLMCGQFIRHSPRRSPRDLRRSPQEPNRLASVRLWRDEARAANPVFTHSLSSAHLLISFTFLKPPNSSWQIWLYIKLGNLINYFSDYRRDEIVYIDSRKPTSY